MRVSVNRGTEHRIDIRAVRKACLKAMKAERVRRDAVLSLSLVSEREMSEFNRRYLGREGPTDVLAFPMQEENARGYLLGDVVICPEYILENKNRYDVNEGKEFELVAIHGVLHLLGYEDERDEDALVMERRQREILGVAEEVKR